MATGFIYESPRRRRVFDLPILKQALLFFDHIVVKVERDDFSGIARADIEGVRWLSDNGVLEVVQSAEFMTHELATLQLELFRSYPEWSGESFSWAAVVSAIAAHRSGPLGLADIEQGVHDVLVEAAEDLYERGLLLYPGRDLPAGLEMPAHEREELRRGLYDLSFDLRRDRSESSTAEGSDLVILHPKLATLHEAVISVAAPSVGAARGETWVPMVRSRPKVPTAIRGDVDVFGQALRTTRAVALGAMVRAESDHLTGALDAASFDDIVSFRNDHADELDSYLAHALEAIGTSTFLEGEELNEFLARRALQRNDAARDLRSASIRRFGVQSLGTAVGAAGLGWYLPEHDVRTAALQLISALATLFSSPSARPDSRFAYVVAFGA